MKSAACHALGTGRAHGQHLEVPSRPVGCSSTPGVYLSQLCGGGGVQDAGPADPCPAGEGPLGVSLKRALRSPPSWGPLPRTPPPNAITLWVGFIP